MPSAAPELQSHVDTRQVTSTRTLTLMPSAAPELQSHVAMRQVIRAEPCHYHGVPRKASWDASASRDASACGHYRSEISDVLTLSPDILTLCAGSCEPFDFALRPERLTDLYESSQLNVHLYAALHDRAASDAVMRETDRLDTLLHVESVGRI